MRCPICGRKLHGYTVAEVNSGNVPRMQLGLGKTVTANYHCHPCQLLWLIECERVWSDKEIHKKGGE